MQRLVLLRHAEAEISAAGGDFDRRLTARGLREALAAGQSLAAHGLSPSLVIVSTAVRAVETWEAMAGLFPRMAVTFDPNLYHAGPEALMEAAELAGAEAVMLVAHNPGIHQLAVALAAEGGDADAALRGFPPAAAAAFRFVDGEARLEAVLHPGEPPPPVYKILPQADWAQAVQTGAYQGSADDARDDFIHLSARGQVAETARRHFHGREGLVLVALDPRELGAGLKWERSRGGALFPHLYGPLPAAAALQVRPLPLGADGAPDTGPIAP
jgi:uncharacterized protein (DUF952 family)/phosphohistidine phosphatase SixA